VTYRGIGMLLIKFVFCRSPKNWSTRT